MLRSASSSARSFQAVSNSIVNRCESLSIIFAQFWHNQRPLSALARSFGVKPGSKRGPPVDAAVICAATPTFRAFDGSTVGPLVNARHRGLEQWLPTRNASARFTDSEKSSRMVTLNPIHRGRPTAGYLERQMHCELRVVDILGGAEKYDTPSIYMEDW